jgi:replicative DNA helicase
MKQKQIQILTFEGMIPPQAVELEAAVLGAMLLEPEASRKILALITTPEMFYDFRHQLIFKAMSALASANSPIDILTVTHELRRMNSLVDSGGALFVSKLTNSIASTANIEVHARVVVERYIARELQQINLRALRASMDDSTDIFELHHQTAKEMRLLVANNSKHGSVLVRELVGEMMDDIDKRKNDSEYNGGVPTHINSLRSKIVNYGKSDLIIIAARPGMGKTGFLLSEAYEQARRNIPVAIFSLEMSRMQLMYRLASLETGIDIQNMSKRPLDSHEYQLLNEKLGEIERLPIYIDDTPGLSINDCRSETRRLVEKFGVQMVYIDYLQLMTAGTKERYSNREQDISEISRNCKLIAKENNIPVMALSQLSRGVESRPDKRPQLSDLRESGSIEQDADMVAFVYRDSYYNPEANDSEAEVIIRKCRNGSLGICMTDWTAHIAKFSSCSSGISVGKFIEPSKSFMKEVPF